MGNHSGQVIGLSLGMTYFRLPWFQECLPRALLFNDSHRGKLIKLITICGHCNGNNVYLLRR